MRIVPRRLSIALAAGALCALAGVGPVAATTPSSEHGLIGAYHLTDSDAYPGVRCRYPDSDNNLHGFRIRPPVVYARSTTAGVDHQWVGYRAIVRYAPDEGSFSTVALSPIHKARASDASAAPLTRTDLPIDGAGSGRYRIVIQMFWYVPGGATAVQGSATQLVHHYTYHLVGNGSIGYCPGGIF